MADTADVRHSFATTKRLNKVCKDSVLCGSDNIGVKGRTILESGAVLRGDLSTIELGSYCVIGTRAVVRPPEQTFQGRIAYIPITIGDHVLIEEDSIIEAASIGECTHIGKRCIVGPRCILSPCCRLLDGAVLPAGSVTAPFSVWAGCPAIQVGRLPDSFQMLWQDHMISFYKHFLPLPAASGAPVAGTTTTASGSTTAESTPNRTLAPSPTPSPSPRAMAITQPNKG